MSEDVGGGEGGGGGSKMLLIVGLVAGLALGGGLTFVLVGGGPDGPPPGEESAVEEVEPEIEVPANLLTIKFERVAVPIYSEGSGGRRRFLGNYFIDIEIQTRDEGDQLLVRQSEPRLRHAFVDAISKPGLMQKDNPLQIDAARAREVFIQRAHEIVGPDLIYDISITNSVRVSG